MKILKQYPMFWDFLTYRRGSALWTPWIRGCERSDQLRANKRGFFKIASHILENHRLLLRSCFLNTVNKRLWKGRFDLSVKDENLETVPHVLRFFDLSPRVSSLNTVNKRLWKHREAPMTIRKNFLKQLLMFWKIQAYFKELMLEHRE